MNIEELEQIKEDLRAVYNVMYNFDDTLCDDMQERVNRIKKVVTAYENLKSYNKGTKEALRSAEELEHQANKEAGDWEARYFELEAELEKEKEKNKKAIDFINDKNNYFEDGENWQNILKIKEILEE